MKEINKNLKCFLHKLGFYDPIKKTVKFVERLKYRHIKNYTAIINGVSIHYNTEGDYSNDWFYPRYSNGRIHEKNVTLLLLEILQKSNCFMDIGANLGWYTCVAAKHMPNGLVYGFEMDDLNFSLLNQNIALNNCHNVEVHQVAVSDIVGVVSYFRGLNQPNPKLYLMEKSVNGKTSETISVNSITIDSFLENKRQAPDVIKIDVEGAEMKVLIGLEKTLRTYKPTLFLEIHPNNLRDKFQTSTATILSYLFVNNYDVFEIEDIRGQEFNRSLKPVNEKSIINENTMLYAVQRKQEIHNEA